MGRTWGGGVRLALTIWNGRVSPVCDVARQLLVLDLEDGRERARRLESLEGADCRQRAARLGEIRPDVLICGAISWPLAGMLAAKGIRVIAFIAGTAEEVLAAYAAGSLGGPAFAMPGCCAGRCGWGRGGRGWRRAWVASRAMG